MHGNPLRLVYAADDSYVLPLAVSVRSLLDACGVGTSVDLMVLSCGISESDKRGLVDSWASEHLRSLDFVEIDMQRFGRLRRSPSDERAARAKYARLTIPEAVPRDWTRVLYLDADTVVRADLTELWSWDLGGKAVAARRDPIITELGHPGGVQCYQEIGADPRAPYFNSGVMLIDLDIWRDRDLADEVMSYVRIHRGKMNLNDQEALNAVLRGDFAVLPWEWNTITFIGRDGIPRPPGEDVAELSRILHFVGPLKPWNSDGTQVPGADYFLKSLDRTVWCDRRA